MKVLVTGGSGFIGRACVAELGRRGIGHVAPSSPELDVLDAASVDRTIARERPTHLLHAAWRPVHGDIMASPQNAIWADASLVLARLFRASGGERAAFVGTSAEYDWTTGSVLRTGETALNPATPYGKAKRALRLALREIEEAGLSVVWPRVFFVYGPHDHPSRLGMAVLAALLRGETVDLTSGVQIRDYTYVDDVAEGLVMALLSDFEGETDLASGAPHSVRAFASEIGRQLGAEHLLRFGARPNPAHDAPIVVGDPAHARIHLGWTARTPLELGVSKFIAWGRDNLRP